MPTWDVVFDRQIALDELDLMRRIVEAEAVARLVGEIPLRASVRDRLDRLNIMRAVRGTTGIEGTDLAEDEVQRILAAPPQTRVLPPSKAREEQETRNAESVMRLIAETLEVASTLPLDEAFIATIHRLTTGGIDYPNNVPGAYRTHAVSAGTYVPPRDGESVRRLMGEFVVWLNSPPAVNWPPTVRAIAAHFYFISIHPFGDGNGRTARAIESYLFYQAGINVRGFYSLANFYYRRRADYERLLDLCRFNSEGDLTPFVRLAVGGLGEELETVRSEVVAEANLTAFREYGREQIFLAEGVNAPVKARLTLLMDAMDGELSEAPLLSGSDPRARLWGRVSRKTMTRDLARLEEMGLIERTAGLIRPRLDLMKQSWN